MNAADVWDCEHNIASFDWFRLGGQPSGSRGILHASFPSRAFVHRRPHGPSYPLFPSLRFGGGHPRLAVAWVKAVALSQDYKGLADNLGTLFGWATESRLLAQAVSLLVGLLGTILTVSAQEDPPTGPVSLQVFLWPNLALGRAVSEIEQILLSRLGVIGSREEVSFLGGYLARNGSRPAQFRARIWAAPVNLGGLPSQ